MQHLERNRPLVLHILREINRRHSSFPQLTIYRVRL
jgi:hypothetical protein